jgi:hypothetical protein
MRTIKTCERCGATIRGAWSVGNLCRNVPACERRSARRHPVSVFYLPVAITTAVPSTKFVPVRVTETRRGWCRVVDVGVTDGPIPVASEERWIDRALLRRVPR